ncbi:MAG TPA: ATP-binding protein, partial [Telluria sp.]|nr:ATP-binding protein [Telluria sp.]
KRLALEFSVGSVPQRVQCDRVKLMQVLNNLLHNAIKFTECGWVHLAVEAEDDFLRFEVSDTGPGIPPALQEHIFEKFYQVESLNAGRSDGTGLGLSLVRELVGMMGGEVRVQSQPGHGTTFIFTIPRIDVADQPAQGDQR